MNRLAIALTTALVMVLIIIGLFIANRVTGGRLADAVNGEKVAQQETIVAEGQAATSADINEAITGALAPQPIIIRETERTVHEILASPGSGDLVSPDSYDAFMRGLCSNPARPDSECRDYRGRAGEQPAP